MITKDNLIDMLNKSLANEDEFVQRFGRPLLIDIAGADLLDDREKREIANLLESLLEDTKK